MANSFTNKYVKNYCKQTILLQLIVQDVITFFGTQCIMRVMYMCEIRADSETGFSPARRRPMS